MTCHCRELLASKTFPISRTCPLLTLHSIFLAKLTCYWEKTSSQIMLPPDIKPGPTNASSAWKTIFGWTLLGPFQSPNLNQSSAVSSFNKSVQVEASDHLLSHFWEVKEVYPESIAFIPEEEEVQNHSNTLISFCHPPATIK